MIAMHQQTLALEPNRAHLQVGGLRSAPDETQADRAIAQSRHDFADRLDRRRDDNPRIPLGQRLQQAWRGLITRTTAVGDQHTAVLSGAEGPHAPPQLIGRG